MLNRLKTFRERRKLTESDLAAAVNVSRQTIVSVEKGKYDPSLPLAKEIARYFRVAVEDIFPRSERGHGTNDGDVPDERHRWFDEHRNRAR